MAKCDIPIYDELPGRVGFIDVDYLRYELNNHIKSEEKIRKELDKAVEKNK